MTRLHLLTPPDLVADGLRLLLQAAGLAVVVLAAGGPAAGAAAEPDDRALAPDGLLLVDLRRGPGPWLAWHAPLAAMPADQHPRCLLLVEDRRHWRGLPPTPPDTLWAVLGAEHSTADLLSAITAVARGERRLPDWLAHDDRAAEAAALAALGPALRQVLALSALDLPPPAIGARLGLDAPEVQARRRRAMRQLGLSDQVQLVRFALRTGLIDAHSPPAG